MKTNRRYTLAERERAVRLLFDQQGQYPSQWAAIQSIAGKLGCTAETLRRWARQIEVNQGKRGGTTSSDRERLMELERENRELKRANEILRKASAFFAQAADPARRCNRVKQDSCLEIEIQRVWVENLRVYGARKIWRQLKREGIETARCTVERLTKGLGIEGARRGAKCYTTTPINSQERPADLVNRQFTAIRPNQLWVADITFVGTWSGFVYVAFVIDVFARCIVGWRVSRSLKTDLVLDALEQALWSRNLTEGLVHHSDRGSQYLSICYTQKLAEAGIKSSVGSVGDSYDNALAETINGLYKTEVIRRRGPWKNMDEVEYATLEWVDWFNNRRILEPIGNNPPAEYELMYYQQLEELAKAA